MLPGWLGDCVYDCAALKRHYFPAVASRCFLYDAVAGGWPAELLALKNASNHKTITVPTNENWIVQGALGADGVPIRLDARLSSGAMLIPTAASIIVRHVRFTRGTGSPPELDPDSNRLNGQDGPMGGSAIYYEGGGMSGMPVPLLIFEHLLVDHNIDPGWSTAVFIRGNRLPAADQRPTERQMWHPSWLTPIPGITILMDSCVFFRNGGTSFWVRGHWPLALTVNNSRCVDGMGTPHNANFVFTWSDPSSVEQTLERKHSFVKVQNTHMRGPYGPGFMPFFIGGLNRDLFRSREFPSSPYVIDVTFERSTFQDIYSPILAGVWIQEEPNKDVNVKLIETRFANLQGSMAIMFGRDNKPALTSVELTRLLVEDCKDPLAKMKAWPYRTNAIVNIVGSGPQSPRITDSVFQRNAAGLGGALLVSGEEVRLIMTRCSFIKNEASMKGGAIALATKAGQFLIQNSMFIGNSVAAESGSSASFVMKVLTGQPGVMFPIVWQIDDGPVFGVSYEECEKARHISEAGVQGERHPDPRPNLLPLPPPTPLPASWPQSPCANVTYEPDQMYATAIELTEGSLDEGATVITPHL
jgi:hypothetical protein